MNRLRAGDERRAQDASGVQIALRRARGTDAVGFVGKHGVQAAAVGFGINRDRGDAHLLAGADDAHRDLAAVRDQDLRKHQLCFSISAKENSVFTQSFSPT